MAGFSDEVSCLVAEPYLGDTQLTAGMTTTGGFTSLAGAQKKELVVLGPQPLKYPLSCSPSSRT